MLKIWCIHLFLQCCEKNWCIDSIFFVFQFGRLKLAEEQSLSIRYVWLKQAKNLNTVAECFNENIILVKLVVSQSQFIWISFVSLPTDAKHKVARNSIPIDSQLSTQI